MYQHLLFLSHIFIIKTKITSSWHRWTFCRLSCLGPLVFLLTKTLKSFNFKDILAYLCLYYVNSHLYQYNGTFLKYFILFYILMFDVHIISNRPCTCTMQVWEVLYINIFIFTINQKHVHSYYRFLTKWFFELTDCSLRSRGLYIYNH